MELYFKIPGTNLEYRRLQGKLFWLFLIFVNFAVVTYVWWNSSHYYIAHPADGNFYIALGRITGLWAELFILLELMLIARLTSFEQTFGFDILNKWHRWVGYSILVFLLGHPILLTVGYAMQQQVGLVSQLGDFLNNYVYVFWAFISVMLFAFIVSISVPIARKRMKYELWYFTHLLVYVAVGLAFLHQIQSGDVSKTPALYYWYVLNFTAFGVMLLYRMGRPLFTFARYGFKVSRVAQETPDTYSVYVTGRNIGTFIFKAGQYANLTFLAGGVWFTHPFSISCEPNDQYLRFTIKALGDYTKKIKDLTPGTYVIIDGPLGLFIEQKALRPKLLFIAGGIGITPIRALIGDLVRSGIKKDMVLIYAVRTPADIAFKAEFELFASTYHVPITYVLSTPTPGFESGYVDKEKIVRLVPDFFDRDVYLCGPPPMMAACVTTLTELGIPKKDIHFEKFSF